MNNIRFFKIRLWVAVLWCCCLGVSMAEEYDLYLVAGQSNCDGRALTSDLSGRLAGWAGEQTNVVTYYTNPINKNPMNPSYLTGWTNLKPGFSVAPGYSGSLPSPTFGPAVSFGKMMADSFPNRKIALIKVTKGGTNMHSDWSPTGNGLMWQTFTNHVTWALQELTDAGHTFSLKGMIWHQGESDINRTSAEFSSDLTHFLGATRAFVGQPELPIVLGELADQFSARTDDMNAVVALDPYATMASAVGLEFPDDVHFSSLSQLALGRRYGALVQNFSTPARLIENDKIIFFGDSITQKGVQANGYVTLFSDRVASLYPSANIQVSGAGVSGNKIADLEARLDSDVLSQNPTVVVIYTGINDVWHWTKPDPRTGLPREGTTAANYEAGLSNLVQRIEATGSRVVLCTPTVISEQVDPDDANYVMLEEFSAISRSVAAEADCQSVDLRLLFTDYLLLNNIADASSGILTTDSVHMNDEGNQLLADAFENALLTVAGPLPEIGNVEVSMAGSNLVFHWASSPMTTYTLQSRTNLVEGSWNNSVENISGTDGLKSFTNTLDGSVSFYRIMGNGSLLRPADG